MAIMNDEDLVDRIGGTDPIITGVREPLDWYSKDSPIQSSSIDLTVGEIFVPGTPDDDEGGANKSLSEICLEQGHTAVVLSAEELKLPNDIAGIGSPPSRLSVRGLLLMNHGHVDPGGQVGIYTSH